MVSCPLISLRYYTFKPSLGLELKCKTILLKSSLIYFLNTFRNGDQYEGCWLQDQRQGHGVMQFGEGSVYEVGLNSYSIVVFFR